MYVRAYLVKAFGWDDIFMVVALLSHVLFAACAIGGIHWGTGRHMDELSDEEIFMALRVGDFSHANDERADTIHSIGGYATLATAVR